MYNVCICVLYLQCIGARSLMYKVLMQDKCTCIPYLIDNVFARSVCTVQELGSVSRVSVATKMRGETMRAGWPRLSRRAAHVPVRVFDFSHGGINFGCTYGYSEARTMAVHFKNRRMKDSRNISSS